MELVRALDCLESVFGFAHDLEVRAGVEDHPKAAADEGLVVAEQDLDRRHALRPIGKRADTE
jgi:hypothetical protein